MKRKDKETAPVFSLKDRQEIIHAMQ